MYKYFSLTIILSALIAKTAFGQTMVMPISQARQTRDAFLLAMDTMMTKMNNVKGAGSPGADFLLQMIPHHEGAIAMADYEIQNGKNFGMVQLAKSIKAEQASEIQLMRIMLQQLPADKSLISKNYTRSMTQAMNMMMVNMPADTMLTNTDRSFAMVMLPHHQAAIDMGRIILTYATDQQISIFAKLLIADENIEIEQMHSFLNHLP